MACPGDLRRTPFNEQTTMSDTPFRQQRTLFAIILPFVLLAAHMLPGVLPAAGDTLYVTLRQADSLFLNRNFQLLAAEMQVEATRALEIQARLYPNPVLTADVNAVDPENGRAFHVGATGQKAFQFEQLILLGGKRRAEIDLARTQVAIAELALQDLLRRLKFRLHTELAEIGQSQALLRRYNDQLALLDTIMDAYAVQVEKGNLPLRDLVRLRSVYLNLNNDRAELLNTFYESQAHVQTLLQTQDFIVFLYADSDIGTYVRRNTLETLRTEALASHPHLLMMRQNQAFARQYFDYQRRLAIPDVSLFSTYDQRGGAFNNQINLGLAVPLPVWNRNQGHIQHAQYQLLQTNYAYEALQQEILSNLQNHYARYMQTVAEYERTASLYNDDFETTLRGMSDNFQKRNISLIEFVDFFESYNLAVAELARIKTQLVTSAELLNLSIGKDLY
ncbi:MAG: TolC family protein [Bacteroidia bacterium]